MAAETGLLIASGRTADVYTWGSEQVVKLFHDWFELDNILFEKKVAQAVKESGYPVPAVGEIVRVNGRNGLLYQRVEGSSMWEILSRKPWRMYSIARCTAELQAMLHGTTAPEDLPDQRQRIKRKIEQAGALPGEICQKALAAVEDLPGGNSICHGDFHPGNILITKQGEVIIDWTDASRGNPLADLARSSILARGAVATTQVPQVGMKVTLWLFHGLYLRRYFHLRPGGLGEFRRWLPVVAAARLSENIPELEQWLVAQAAG